MAQFSPVDSLLRGDAPTRDFLQPSSLRYFGALLLLFAVYYIYGRLELAISRRRTAREHDCEPVKLSPALNTFSNRVLGWKLPLLLMKGFKARKVLENLQKVLFESCNTVQVKLASRDVIFTVEPDNLKTILASNFSDWAIATRRKRAFGVYMGHGIFTADGLAWKHSRELLRPNFARSQIENPVTLEPHVSTLLDAIPRDGSTFDLQELFFSFTADVAIEFLFGFDPARSKEPITGFAKALDRITAATVRRIYFGRLMNVFRRSLQKDASTLNDFIDHHIDLAIENKDRYALGRTEGERYVFLREVVQRTQDRAQIRSQILHVLQAGKDTTASLLSHTWFTLAKRPDVWDTLRAEVDDLKGAKPSFAALQEMKYLRAVLNESLRLYPVTPVLARMASRDTVLPVGGGQDGKSSLLVPKGQQVSWSSYVMHRRKDIYGEDADEFRPERWETLRPGGPRVCLGQKFALTEAAYATVRLMQEFPTLKSCDPEPWREQLTFTLAVGNGVKVSMREREIAR